MFVVVVFMLIMVIIWCLERFWLCDMVIWPNRARGGDVVFGVVNVVLDVVIVVICRCCDGVVHGELLVDLIMLAGCPCVVVALVVVVVMVKVLWLMLLMLWWCCVMFWS